MYSIPWISSLSTSGRLTLFSRGTCPADSDPVSNQVDLYFGYTVDETPRFIHPIARIPNSGRHAFLRAWVFGATAGRNILIPS
jgi:hypothetical protein